jgi:hypothetical protein
MRSNLLNIPVCLLIAACGWLLFACGTQDAKPGIRLLGNMFMVGLPTKFDQSYKLVIHGKENVLFPADGYVIETYGNDSLLVAKCISETGDIRYFQVNHGGGHLLSAIQPITTAAYNQFRDTGGILFNFTDDARYNWK